MQFVHGCHYCKYKLLVSHSESVFARDFGDRSPGTGRDAIAATAKWRSAQWALHLKNPKSQCQRGTLGEVPAAGKASADTHACIRHQRTQADKNPSRKKGFKSSTFPSKTFISDFRSVEVVWELQPALFWRLLSSRLHTWTLQTQNQESKLKAPVLMCFY